MIRLLLGILFFTGYMQSLTAQLITGADTPMLVKNSYPDEDYVNKLNSYAERIQFSDPQTAIRTLQVSIESAEKIRYPLGLSIAYGLRAGLFFYEMKLDTCIILLNKAYALVKDSRETGARNQAANLLNRYGAIEQRRQNFDIAVERYLEASKIFNETGDRLKIIFTYYNLSGIYKFLGDTSRMFYYAYETYRLALDSKDQGSAIRGLIALGDAYNVAGNYDSVLIISRKGLQMAQQQQLTFAVGIFNNFIGLYFTNKDPDYDSALIYFNRALQSFTEINVLYDMSLVYQNMGNAYLKKGDYTNAIKFSLKAAALAKELNLNQVLYLSLRDLVIAEERKGNIIESFKYLKEYVQINDSIQNKNNEKKVYELQSKYQEQQKEMMLLAKQKIIEQKNLLNYLLGSGVFFLIIIFVLLYRNYRHTQKIQQQRISDLETDKKLTAAEAVLKGEEQERARLAKDLHDGLGGMLSGIKYSLATMKRKILLTPENKLDFDRNLGMIDNSINEMRRVAHNMMPESLVNFGLDTALEDFCNDINKSGALNISYQSIGMKNIKPDQTISITVYRIVQELINNTMKHAAAENAIVQLTKVDNLLSLTVEDDGTGFDTGFLSPGETGASMDHTNRKAGWRNITNRVEFLKGNMDIQSGKNTGTSVHIVFKI